MKKLFFGLLIVCALVAPTNAYAVSCEVLETLARSIMTARQDGVSMKSMVETATEGNPNEGTVKGTKMMITDAFNTPRYNSFEYRDKAINEFANKYYRVCVEGELDY